MASYLGNLMDLRVWSVGLAMETVGEVGLAMGTADGGESEVAEAVSLGLGEELGEGLESSSAESSMNLAIPDEG